MFDYLQQFNKLPKELKDKVSSPLAMDVLLSLEKKYNVNLAMVTMQVMVKQILFKNLPAYFSTEMGLDLAQANALTAELREKIFFSLSNYLGLRPQVTLTPEEKDLEVLMKENNIILPSQELLARSRNILLTYRKGVRSKIDARAALERAVDYGGIGLDAVMAERLLALMADTENKDMAEEDKKKGVTAMANSEKVTDSNMPPTPVSQGAQKEIDNLINREELAASYDLKKTLEGGELKVPNELAAKFKPQTKALDPSHELKAPEAVLALKDSVKTEQGEIQAKLVIEKELVSEKAEDLAKESLESEPKAKTEVNQALAAEKVEQLANLEPEKKLASESFKKPGSQKKAKSGGMFSKLFKSKKTKEQDTASPLAGMKSVHLEAMVKAASLESQMKPRAAASSDSRPKMHDVKVRPKMMGPLEELRYLDLTNFRRLGDNPEIITKKIEAKIKILKKDGYDKMVLGVQAWRQSPVNRSYVKLMQEAVIRGLTIDELLKIRKEQDKFGLSKEEITAIVDLNSKLLF